MPRVSRQHRYETLEGIPGNEFTYLNPHPLAQTRYEYPFSKRWVMGIFYLTFAMILSGIFGTLLCRFTSNEDLCIKALAFCLFPPFPFALTFFFLVSPTAGIWNSRIMDLPSGEAAYVYVHRPFFGRKKCESKFGVTGGNPTMEGLTNSKKRIRYEPALVVVDW